ncbi:MFS family permease [Kutzneria viridogrisea]|uniref:MFS family permease n=1 Tax=Kutzneria viridogrisea TaxID=47990 RepID=A0ABR6BQ01_9PSEU|nr:MFS family permease [Kutzneria viridogrisea]MBA8931347.1 MFS family permease [Kutzneria viridogrisea]
MTFLARVPVAGAGVALTLHVVLGLGMGYAAAGLVGAASTIGMAIGGPLLGRLVDRRGLRAMLLLTTVAEVLFWGTAPWLPYPALVVLSLVLGVLTLPVMSVSRQATAALVPPAQHHTAFSLDSVFTEAAFMVGPAISVLIATSLSTVTALLTIGSTIVLSGVLLYLVNPPVRGEDAARAEPVPRRSWLRGPMIAVLVITSAVVMVMAGTEVAIVSVLNTTGEVSWSGLVIALWCLASIIGGLVHGARRTPLHPVLLIGLIGLFTVPVGLAGNWWALALLMIPSGLLCAPTVAATSGLVVRLSPESARGEAMGIYQSALTIGVAVGSPLVGAVVDRSTPAWGFVTIGIAGLLAASLALLLGGRVLGGARSEVQVAHGGVDALQGGPGLGHAPAGELVGGGGVVGGDQLGGGAQGGQLAERTPAEQAGPHP